MSAAIGRTAMMTEPVKRGRGIVVFDRCRDVLDWIDRIPPIYLTLGVCMLMLGWIYVRLDASWFWTYRAGFRIGFDLPPSRELGRALFLLGLILVIPAPTLLPFWPRTIFRWLRHLAAFLAPGLIWSAASQGSVGVIRLHLAPFSVLMLPLAIYLTYRVINFVVESETHELYVLYKRKERS